MSRLIRSCAVLVVIALLSLSVVSAQSTTWKLLNAQSIADMTGAGQDLRYAALSPDGSTIAWGSTTMLCVFHLESGEKNCDSAPPNFATFGGSDLSWSPDGKTLVYTEAMFDETDIWTFDPVTATMTDHTDDNVYEGHLGDASDSAPHDTVPTWNPENGDLYFFRKIASGTNQQLTLQLLPLARTEPKQVSDLSGDFRTSLVLPPATISPDGLTMVLFALPRNSSDKQTMGWQVNLKDGSLQSLISVDDAKIGLPDWATENSQLEPNFVQWVGSKAFVVSAFNYVQKPDIPGNIYYMDLSTKTITPFADLTAVPDATAFFGTSGDSTSPVYRLPRAGVVTPDGSAYLYVTYGKEADKAYVWSQPLPPDGSAPTQIGVIDPFKATYAPDMPPAISADGKHVLLLGYWLTLQPPGG